MYNIHKSGTGVHRVGQYRVHSTAVQKYRGTVTRYFFSTVIGTVDTFEKMYRFWYRRYFLDRFTRYFDNFFE